MTGGSIPHFQVTDVDGALVRYDTIWQRQAVVLVCADEGDGGRRIERIGRDLRARADTLASLEARLVVTRETVDGVPRPGVVIADRWGEVFAVIDDPARTDVDDLIEWLRWVQMKCPECEGEAY